MRPACAKCSVPGCGGREGAAVHTNNDNPSYHGVGSRLPGDSCSDPLQSVSLSPRSVNGLDYSSDCNPKVQVLLSGEENRAQPGV